MRSFFCSIDRSRKIDQSSILKIDRLFFKLWGVPCIIILQKDIYRSIILWFYFRFSHYSDKYEKLCSCCQRTNAMNLKHITSVRTSGAYMRIYAHGEQNFRRLHAPEYAPELLLLFFLHTKIKLSFIYFLFDFYNF